MAAAPYLRKKSLAITLVAVRAEVPRRKAV